MPAVFKPAYKFIDIILHLIRLIDCPWLVFDSYSERSAVHRTDQDNVDASEWVGDLRGAIFANNPKRFERNVRRYSRNFEEFGQEQFTLAVVSVWIEQSSNDVGQSVFVGLNELKDVEVRRLGSDALFDFSSANNQLRAKRR